MAVWWKLWRPYRKVPGNGWAVKSTVRALMLERGVHSEEFLSRLCNTCAGVSSIWLIGSRANGTAREDSDWDFIVFANHAVLECIKAKNELHLANVDFLVVYDGEQFANAWGEKEKTGSLSSWQWLQKTDECAEYTENKWVEDKDGGDVVSRRRNAIRVWPKPNAP